MEAETFRRLSEDELPEDEDIPASLEEESLLDLARAKYRDILLNFHYRSNYEELIAFSNYAFYKAGLYVSPNVRVPKNPPIEVLKIDNGLWTKRANVPEAKKVVELLKWILSARRNNETIGIITFNISQRDMIDDLIDEEVAADPKFAAQIRNELGRTQDGQDIGLFVKNIESVQGDERDIIIFSVGYARNENGRIIRNFGWLNQKGGENRLNVAVSRAKKKVYVVTSINPEELQVEDAKNNGPRFLKKYLEYAFAISNRDNEAARNVLHSFGDQVNPGEYVTFDSIFEEQVYTRVMEEQRICSKKDKTEEDDGNYPFDIPDHWKWIRLNHLVAKEIRRGKSPKYATLGSALSFAQKCNSKHTGIRLDLAQFLDEDSLARYTEVDNMVDNDIVVNSTGGGTLGRVGLYKDIYNPESRKVYPDSHVTVVRAKKRVCPEYLYYCLKYYSPYLETLGEGSTNQTELKPATLKNLYIPIPPIEEQQRIVDKLDSLLPICDELAELA